MFDNVCANSLDVFGTLSADESITEQNLSFSFAWHYFMVIRVVTELKTRSRKYSSHRRWAHASVFVQNFWLSVKFEKRQSKYENISLNYCFGLKANDVIYD